MPSAVKSQNLSIMLTDIQGYSSTTANASREEVVDLIRRHSKLMRPVIEFYGGTIVKSIGDAFLCTFPSATDAVICAIIIQLLLKEYNQRLKDEANHLNLRVVINSGDVSIEENDIFGNAVNVTARMEALDCFPGGSIGISESTYLLMDRSEIVAEKIGAKQLKGVPDPVTVFSVPLEKQKLNKLPMQLLNLVEKVVNAKGSDASGTATAQLNEWSHSISSFLKQTNWGDNVNKASQQIGNIQQSLVKTFGQKTVLEQKKKYTDAGMAARIKSGLIDLIILTLIMLAMRMAWWPVQRIVYGPTSVISYEDIQGAHRNWENVMAGNQWLWVRKQGIFEWVININIKFPVLALWLYFAIFWKWKHASPGQIAAGTAVIKSNGEDNMELILSLKRSAMFLVACFTIIGVMMVFFGEKKTLYDKLCDTRVIE